MMIDEYTGTGHEKLYKTFYQAFSSQSIVELYHYYIAHGHVIYFLCRTLASMIHYNMERELNAPTIRSLF